MGAYSRTLDSSYSDTDVIQKNNCYSVSQVIKLSKITFTSELIVQLITFDILEEPAITFGR